MTQKHSHYFKPVPAGVTHIDVYRVLELFGVTDPCIQHAVKKLLVAGGRGPKDIAKDIQEAIDTLERRMAMWNEVSSCALKAEAMANGAALAASAVTADLDDGWIEWKGGVCSPVDVGTQVEVRLRSGERDLDNEVKFRWRHAGGDFTLNSDFDIVAYRVVPSGD